MKFDLEVIASKKPRFFELIPKKNCLMMKLANPKSAAMLFSSGKLVCTGANTEEGVKLAARKFTHVIQVCMSSMAPTKTHDDLRTDRQWIILVLR